MKTIFKLTAILFVSAAIFCSCGDAGDEDQTPTLEGEWKLKGMVNVETGVLKVLEPKECDKCYRITFHKNNTFSFHTAVNLLTATFSVDYTASSITVLDIKGTEISELFDGFLFRNTLNIVQFFSLETNELRLYYNSKKHYLVFIKV